MSNQSTCKASGQLPLTPLLTPEFLAQLRRQLGQKVKPSRSVLEALKHSNQLNQQYKRQIEQLRFQLDQLVTQQSLRSKDSLTSTTSQTTQPLSSQRLDLASTVSLSVKAVGHQSLPSLEVELLRQKVLHLEELSKTRERRCEEMVDREAVLIGEIDLLKLKNQTLSLRIKSLEEQQQKFAQKRLKDITVSVNNSLPEEVLNDQASVFPDNRHLPSPSSIKPSNFYKNSWFKEESQAKVETEEQQLSPYVNLGRQQWGLRVSCVEMDASMMASCTKMIEIQEEYDIERKATLIEPLRDEEEFNEIDAILGEEVPKLQSGSLPEEEVVMENINSSFINIRVIDENQKQPMDTIFI